MVLTRAADYAVRIMIHLAQLPPGARPGRGALAEAGEVPEQFLSKVLQSLVRARLVESQRGPNGGFRLASPPEQISMLDVIEAIEGPMRLNSCLNTGESCNRKSRCPAHDVWWAAQEAMTKVLRGATLDSLAHSRDLNLTTTLGG